jgi:hypothetical protein
LSELHTNEKEDATVLAMSAWDVMTVPPTEMPGMRVRLHLPDIRRSLFHATSERVDRERLETKAFHDECLASRIPRWALTRKRLNDIKFCNVG